MPTHLQMYMEGLAYGNVTAAEAVQLAAQAEELMSPQGLAAGAWPQPLVLQLGGAGQQQAAGAAAAAAGEDAAASAAAGAAGGAERVSHWPSNPNPGNKNHALYYLLQLGPADARMQVRGRCFLPEQLHWLPATCSAFAPALSWLMHAHTSVVLVYIRRHLGSL